ncbi:MAG: tetratricopeptide repeat protein [Planctomycetota bacterium]|nr:tetratricopeptide repeat protein [Planctomycetota bacterium]
MTSRHPALLLALALLLFGAPAAYADDAETARAHYEKGEWQQAAAAWRKVVDANPKRYDAHVLYQSAHARAGADVTELVTYYDALVQKSPNEVAFQLHRIRLDAAEDRTKPLKALASAHSKNCSVHLEMGRASLAQDDVGKALTAFKKADGIAQGQRTDVVLLYAEALALRRKAKDAQKLLRAAVQRDAKFLDGWVALGRLHLAARDGDAAFTCAETALLLRKTSVPALLVHAQAADLKGNLDAALGSAATALRLAPTLPATHSAMGDYTAKQDAEGTLARAKTYYEKALELDEEFPGALHGLGWVLERQGDYEAAEKHHRTLHDVRPDDPEPANSVGFCLFKRGRISEAQVFFKKAMDLDKNFVPAIANLAMTYDKRKQYAKAIKLYEGILKRKTHKDDLRIILCCAFGYEATEKYRKAVKLFERAHELSPKDVQIILWVADNWYFQEKWSKAQDWYEKATSADPKSFFAWRGVGYCLMQEREWREAASALERAKTLDKEETEMLLVLGDLYLNELDDDQKALDTFKAYVERGGDDPDIPDLITELESRLK